MMNMEMMVNAMMAERVTTVCTEEMVMTERSVKTDLTEQTETMAMTDLMDKMEKTAWMVWMDKMEVTETSEKTAQMASQRQRQFLRRDPGREHHERRFPAPPGVVVSPVRSAGSR